MTEDASSPFLEHASRLEDGQSYSKEKVARLEFELSSIKTEKKLLEQSKESCVARYESLLSRKNEELAQLQSNFDFVYNQRKELQSKLKNQSDVVGKSSSESDSQAKTLRAERSSLSAKVDKYERLMRNEKLRYEDVVSKLKLESSTNAQYKTRLQVLESDNKKLVSLNESLSTKAKSITAQIERESSREIEELQLRLTSLQKTNNELQFKFDSLLQSNTSIELLKSKNASLAQKVRNLEHYHSRVSQLELANTELQAKFDEYFGIISATVESQNSVSEGEVVTNFVQSFKQLQAKNFALTDNLHTLQSELQESQQNHQSLIDRTNTEYLPQIESLKEQISVQNSTLQELKKAKVLNGKEIEFLRKSLKDIDDLVSRQKVPSSSPDNTEKVAMNQYLTNLEKLVDDYKQEIESLRRISAKQSPENSSHAKRPRLIEDEDVRIRASNSLRKENLELSSKIKNLQDECEIMKRKLELEKNSHRSSAQILELRSNPFSADQLVKQETLDVLRRENEDLLSKVANSQNVDSIPKSVFARQENDKELLQSRIDQLAKKINRLRTVYGEKSRDIVSIISRFFGYSIEFIPSPVNPNDLFSKIKLVSRYLNQEDSESSVPYLILDVHSRSLKAHGNFEFKSACEELVNRWVSEKHQIPCFLSALNLKIYEDFGKHRKVEN